jgi:hypothetical protein
VKSVYRSEADRQAIHALYRRALQHWPIHDSERLEGDGPMLAGQAGRVLDCFSEVVVTPLPDRSGAAKVDRDMIASWQRLA